ncbi:NUDIX hydrolase [Paenibacillus apii]|uniref:DNA mismatch repair protein MutT n=1 Tax=Paenibacillus apii TaxID=1850370 RepID=UPI002E2E857A|nr:DNA mismatch repair protein MutT [Paenibacillus apii]
MEFGETAEEAITRELIEEFELEVQVNHLILINESIIEYEGKQRHDCTLFHLCKLKVEEELIFTLWHKERDEIKLTWKTIGALHKRPVYPEGIVEIIESKDIKRINHIIIRKKY